MVLTVLVQLANQSNAEKEWQQAVSIDYPTDIDPNARSKE